MVTRKPLPPDARTSLNFDGANHSHHHSYRAQGVSEQTETVDRPQDMTYDTPQHENAWTSEGEYSQENLPETLRAGPPNLTPSSSQEWQTPIAQSTNPFTKRQQSGQSSVEGFTEHPHPPSKPPPPPPISKDEPPSYQFGALGISEQNTNPWQSSLDSKPLPQNPPQQEPQQPPPSDSHEWSSNFPSHDKAPVLPPVDTTPLITFDSPESQSPAWDEDDPESEPEPEPGPKIHELPGSSMQDLDSNLQENAWADSGKEKFRASPVPQSIPPQDLLQDEDPWKSVDAQPRESIIDSEPTPSSQVPDLSTQSEVVEQAPNLPPRPQNDGNQTMPTRATADIANPRTSSVASPAPQSKSETYEIKKINWYDSTAKKNPRVTPILTQNANGPCPLLALVNALTLSTPAELSTALVDTLRSREQVSLGLLLDAVFDELMSGRRGDAAQELPDVGDLYAFLLTLHTGMNVNPRFVAPNLDQAELRRSMSHVHPSEREDVLPGTFEETREMQLYSTFSVPLIHGWLPSKDSVHYAALKRSANSYEDAQHLMFREEELEEKLQVHGLSFEEQATLEDIGTISAFLSSSATQLTPYGLETITKSMRPGSIAIFFRNDHFSTLYKHPDTYQLLQLVTDQGYAGHEEIVWESLEDVNGENCEFFSGDFRLVGGAAHSSARPSVDDSSGWTTVSRRGDNPGHRPSASTNTAGTNLSVDNSNNFDIPPPSPNHEQEDHDLALALQLQEEEEERHREETARRRRESDLSQQYIEQQATQNRASNTNNMVPVTSGGGGRGSNSAGRVRGRGSRSTTNTTISGPPPTINTIVPDNEEVRPVVPPRRNNAGTSISVPSPIAAAPIPVGDPEAGVDAPPPSYEAASQEAPYVPPIDHPSHPSASPNTLSPRTTRRSSAYSANSSAGGGRSRNTSTGTSTLAGPGAAYRPSPLMGGAGNNSARRTSAAAGGDGGRDKECVVM